MTEKDPFYMNEHDTPQQDQSTGVPPAADKNVQSINEYILLIRTARGSEYDGRGGGASWAIGIIVAMVLAFSYWGYTDYLEAKSQNTIEASYYYWGPPVFIAILFTLVSFWVWIPWRTHLPIVFNRSTQKISFWHENELWQGNWKKAEAHTMTVGSAGYGVGVTNEPLLSLNVIRDVGDYPEDKGNLYLKIYGTQWDSYSSLPGKTLSVQAQQIWEYIRLYMNEGIDAVPPPIHDSVPWENKSFIDLIKNNYEAIAESKTIILFLVLFPFGIVNLFLDICYYPFNRWLPRKAIPSELQATIDARGTGRQASNKEQQANTPRTPPQF